MSGLLIDDKETKSLEYESELLEKYLLYSKYDESELE
jgi:hypothetical protein